MKKLLFVMIALIATMAIVGLTVALTRSPEISIDDATDESTAA